MGEPAAALDQVRDQVSCVLSEFLDRQRVVAAGIAGELTPAIDAVADVLAGGKRLRAAFCYWGWRGASGEAQVAAEGGAGAAGVFAVAAALELLHAAALVHDDVLDDSDTRRGGPTIHRSFAARHAASGWRGEAQPFGKKIAIVLGDLLLAWADELFGGSGLPAAALGRGRLVLDLMRTELMAGQYLDLLEQAAGTGGVAGALRVLTYKTAKYTIERPLHLGAALAGPGDADPALLRGYSGYGIPLGVAFQLRDDILGVFGDPSETGKPAGDDLREGKRTVLVAHALDVAGPAETRLFDKLLGLSDLDADGVDELRAVLQATGALDRVEQMILDLTRTARTALHSTEGLADEAVATLDALVDFSTSRSA